MQTEFGVSLVELFVAMGLFGVAIMASAQVLTFIQTRTQVTTLRSTRDQLALTSRRASADTALLRIAMLKPENSVLKKCICGTACTSNLISPVTLYTDANNPIAPYYDQNGAPCAAAPAQCAIRLRTTMRAQCRPVLPDPNPIPPLNCAGPNSVDFVEIAYRLEQNKVFGGQPLLRPVSGSTALEVNEIVPAGMGGLYP